MVYNLTYAVSPVAKGAGNKISKQGIKHKAAYDNKYRHTHNTAAGLKQKKYANYTNYDIKSGVVAYGLDDVLVVEGDIEYCCGGNYSQHIVIPFYPVLAHMLSRRIQQENQ